jgi:hypothetical protein
MSEREPADPRVRALLEEGYGKVLQAFGLMGYPVEKDDNFTETAARAARAAMEMVQPVARIKAEIDEMLSRTFSAHYEDMVISKHNICFGVCPHHLLPVIYRISVAYLPGARVLGISKLSRLVVDRCSKKISRRSSRRSCTRASRRTARRHTSKACTSAWLHVASKRTKHAWSRAASAASSANGPRRGRSSWTSSPRRR